MATFNAYKLNRSIHNSSCSPTGCWSSIISSNEMIKIAILSREYHSMAFCVICFATSPLSEYSLIKSITSWSSSTSQMPSDAITKYFGWYLQLIGSINSRQVRSASTHTLAFESQSRIYRALRLWNCSVLGLCRPMLETSPKYCWHVVHRIVFVWLCHFSLIRCASSRSPIRIRLTGKGRNTLRLQLVYVFRWMQIKSVLRRYLRRQVCDLL